MSPSPIVLAVLCLQIPVTSRGLSDKAIDNCAYGPRVDPTHASLAALDLFEFIHRHRAEPVAELIHGTSPVCAAHSHLQGLPNAGKLDAQGVSLGRITSLLRA